MKTKTFSLTRRTVFIGLASSAFVSCSLTNTLHLDFTELATSSHWKGRVSATRLVDKDDSTAIECYDPKQNVVWHNDIEFTEGVIEFDAKGKSQPPQSSFIGVAFRVVDETTHDAVYFRPFNFRANDPERRSHAIQYVSEPAWPWHRLRKEKPGQYEKPIIPAPDGDDWFHVKIELHDRKVTAFVNDNQEPSLNVNELSNRADGSVGLFCTGYGMVANLMITPAS